METQESIGNWALEVFGRGEAMQPYADRIRSEVEELVSVARGFDETGLGMPAVAEELADILITIRVFAHRFGIDEGQLDRKVDIKMAVNRHGRKWISNGDGTGRHQKSDGHSADRSGMEGGCLQ